MITADLSYRVSKREFCLPRDPNYVAVRFTEPALYSTRAQVARQSGLGPHENRFEIPGEKYTVFPITRPEDVVGAQGVVRRLSGSGEVDRVAPVFLLGNLRVLVTDRILMKLARGVSLSALPGAASLEVLDLTGGVYLLRVPESIDPVALSRDLSTLPQVEFAEPDLVTVGRNPRIETGTRIAPSSAEPRTFEDLIELRQALQIQQGSPQIRIAVLDDGVDWTHPDLSSAVEERFDAITGVEGGTPNDWDHHGTACAGLAAAAGSGLAGVRGVAAGCRLLAVRVAYSQARGTPWVTTSAILARGIRWATDRGADVISASWGGGPPASAVLTEVLRARDQGRRGRGCVVAVAVGNGFSAVEFPAIVDGVLAVGATNQFDQCKTPTSDDGEFWWGSNFGPEIDIAAPGVQLRTTDLAGSAGASQDDYLGNFNGTSAATPLVAGAAALVLSANPALEGSEVCRLLIETADKVDVYPYINGRNDRLGAGRLNIRRALEAVRGEAPPQNGISNERVRQGLLRLARATNGDALPCLTLETIDGAFVVKGYSANEVGAPADLERTALERLSPMVGQQVRLRCDSEEQTANGAFLWGARLDDRDTPADRDDVPPNEVRLGPSEL